MYVLVLISFKNVAMIISSFKMQELTFAFSLWIALLWFIFKTFKEKISKMMMSIFKADNEYIIIFFSYSVFAKRITSRSSRRYWIAFIWFDLDVYSWIFSNCAINASFAIDMIDLEISSALIFEKRRKKTRSREIHFIAHVTSRLSSEWTFDSASRIIENQISKVSTRERSNSVVVARR